jgi:hypothetical protein
VSHYRRASDIKHEWERAVISVERLTKPQECLTTGGLALSSMDRERVVSTVERLV